MRKPSPGKKQKVPLADEKALEEMKAFPSTPLPSKGQPNPVTLIPSSSRLPSALERPREASELLKEDSPMQKLRPSDVSIKRPRSTW